jgi:hypothetical protein
MTVKKKYNVGDTVWIYGISKNNIKSTQGTVIKSFVIDYQGFNNELHYVIGIPTEIEMLLEIRTWHTISQTKDGHVGSIREAFSDPAAAHKMLMRTGMDFASTDEFEGDGHDSMGTVSLNEDFDRFEEHMSEEDEISPDAIHAALEKSQKDNSHSTMMVKELKPRRRNYPSRKKKV